MPQRYRFKEARLAGLVIVFEAQDDGNFEARWINLQGSPASNFFMKKSRAERWLADFCEPLDEEPTDQASELAPYRDELRLEAGEELARRHDQALRVLRSYFGGSRLIKLVIQTLDPTGDQRALLARLEERVVDGTATEAETAQYRQLSANTPTMSRAVDLAVRGLLPKRQQSDGQDIGAAAKQELQSVLGSWDDIPSP